MHGRAVEALWVYQGALGAIVGVSVSTGSLGVILFLPITLIHDSNWEPLVRHCAPPRPQHFHSPLIPVPLLQPQFWGTS